jgi:hypothetical protein
VLARTKSDGGRGAENVRRRFGSRSTLSVFVGAALVMAVAPPDPRERHKLRKLWSPERAVPQSGERTRSADADVRVNGSPVHSHPAVGPQCPERPTAHARATARPNAFAASIDWVLNEGVLAAKACGNGEIEYRPALCAWEDRLFAQFRQGHELITKPDADLLIAEIFAACGRPAPVLELVPGFPDPRIGGYADVAKNRILIEEGFLYRYLVLHEIGHFLIPEDHCHGPAFIYVLQTLYRIYLGIPEEAIRTSLEAHGLPSYTYLPN